MGTRGALGFQKDHKLKVAYNSFDSYFTGLGNRVIEYINSRDIPAMKFECDLIEMVNDILKPSPEQIEKCKNAGVVDLDVSNQSEDDWYCLLRGAQGSLAMYAKVGYMPDNQEFLEDSLFCEYAYIINLDTEKLEIYKGFNKETPKGRFAESKVKNDQGYRPVTLFKEVELGKGQIPLLTEKDYKEE